MVSLPGLGPAARDCPDSCPPGPVGKRWARVTCLEGQQGLQQRETGSGEGLPRRNQVPRLMLHTPGQALCAVPLSFSVHAFLALFKAKLSLPCLGKPQPEGIWPFV